MVCLRNMCVATLNKGDNDIIIIIIIIIIIFNKKLPYIGKLKMFEQSVTLTVITKHDRITALN